jgi:hypothetical protein
MSSMWFPITTSPRLITQMLTLKRFLLQTAVIIRFTKLRTVNVLHLRKKINSKVGSIYETNNTVALLQ